MTLTSNSNTADRKPASDQVEDADEQAISGDSEQAQTEPQGEDALAALTAERDELKDRVLRMAAEMENYKKRSERDKADFLKRANESLARDLLPFWTVWRGPRPMPRSRTRTKRYTRGFLCSSRSF